MTNHEQDILDAADRIQEMYEPHADSQQRNEITRAACIYLAYRAKGEKVTMESLSYEFMCSENTIRRRHTRIVQAIDVTEAIKNG